MRGFAIALIFWLCRLCAAHADAAPFASACNAAGHAAEQQAMLPNNLLLSIGLVESGRPDPESGQISAWPWTVNVDGKGYYFDTEQSAAAFAQAAQAAGAQDVDVGCFQISLEQHPGAFASLQDAFDPAGNAAFAAHFLNDLKLRSGSWQSATADYHSSLPLLGVPYQRRVWTAWRDFGDAPPAFAGAFSGLPDASVILQAPAARQVRVITMDDVPDAAQLPASSGLPRVITP